MNKPYDKCDMDDDFSMIFVYIGDYTIIANLTAYHGEYSASVWRNNQKTSDISYGEASPMLAIRRCKQWIAENQSEVQS